MKRQTADSPLHGGRAPKWLFERMHRLAGPIVQLIVADRGPGEMLRRMADPMWFQAFGCVLGFDWHSSGLTTVTCGAVKEAYRRIGADLGIHAAGGKGGASRGTPAEIARAADARSLAGEQLIYASRMSAKVDSAAVQDGYQIYTHHFFFSDASEWCVVQQGMNDENGYARRYHWLGGAKDTFAGDEAPGANATPGADAPPPGPPLLRGGRSGRLPAPTGAAGGTASEVKGASEAGRETKARPPLARGGRGGYGQAGGATNARVMPTAKTSETSSPTPNTAPDSLWSFVCEPHAGVASAPAGGSGLLNMVALEAADSRSKSVELANINPEKLLREITTGPTLFMPAHHDVRTADINPARLGKVLRIIHEHPPQDFEQLLGAQGVGPATVRGLAFVAELIYGTPVCRRDITRRWSPSDPPTFSYAHGGKDGHPFPVDRRAYDESIGVLECAVRRAKIDPAGKDQALYRLSSWLGRW